MYIENEDEYEAVNEGGVDEVGKIKKRGKGKTRGRRECNEKRRGKRRRYQEQVIKTEGKGGKSAETE